MKRYHLPTLALAAILLLGPLGCSANKVSHGDSGERYSANNQRAQSRQVSAEAPDMVVALIPVAVAKKTGCWATLYNGENFTGHSFSVVGPRAFRNLEFGRMGFDWEGDIGSVEVGPQARLTVYDDENFKDEPRTINAGNHERDIRQGAFSEGVESLTVECTGTMAE